MKTLTVILPLLFASASLAFAADSVVVVNSATSVTIDGQPAGTVVDALANNPGVPNLRARLLDAWIAREKSINDSAQASAGIDRANARAAKQAADDARLASEAKVAAAEAQRDAANKLLADLISAVRAANWAGLTPALKKAIDDNAVTVAEKERAERAAKRAELQEQLSKISP